MKILLAADGSEFTRNAARSLVAHLSWFAERPKIQVLHVRPPFPFPHAAAVAGKSALEGYEREEAQKALAVAEEELRKGNIDFESTWRVGDVAKEIAACAEDHAIDMIVMGSHGHGALRGVALGSTTTKVIATVKVPVLIAR